MSQSQPLNTAMRGLSIPDSGVDLGAPPPTVGNGKALFHGMQAMRIKLDENILHEILQHKGLMGITFGKAAVRETPFGLRAIPLVLFCWEGADGFTENNFWRS